MKYLESFKILEEKHITINDIPKIVEEHLVSLQPFYLVGKPGIGKTQALKEVFKDLAINFQIKYCNTALSDTFDNYMLKCIDAQPPLKCVVFEDLKTVDDINRDRFEKVLQILKERMLVIFTETTPYLSFLSTLNVQTYVVKEAWELSDELVNMNNKTGVFESRFKIYNNMKNLVSFKVFENYPPGAAHDSRAPYNQVSPTEEKEEFDDVLYTEDNEEIPVHIKFYYYYEDSESLRKQITSYDYTITGDRSKLKEEYIDEDIRNLIVDHIGDRFYDWVD